MFLYASEYANIGLKQFFCYINVQIGSHEVSATHRRAQRNLTKTVILVSAGFFTCLSLNEWYYFAGNIGINVSFSGPFYNFTVAMVSLHCCINPLIYIANYEKFRSAVRKLLRVRE